jgi:hypothetical protein
MSWSRKLSKPIDLTDGRKLKTLDDVAELVFTFPDARLHKACWDEAIEHLIDAAILRPSALVRAEALLRAAFKVEGLLQDDDMGPTSGRP